MIGLLLRVQRWRASLIWTAALGLVGWANRGSDIHIPLTSGSVPVALLVMLAAVTVLLGPLYAVVPGLDAGLSREPTVRLVRAVTACALTLGSYLPATWGVDSGPTQWPRIMLLMAVGLIALVAMGEYAWSLVLSMGAIGLLVDGASQTQPVSSALHDIGVLVPAVILFSAGSVYVKLGAKEVRS